MTRLSKEQEIQESMYQFPYHCIPSFYNGNFSQVRILRCGYEYLSYIRFVLQKVESLNFDSLLDVGCGDGKFLDEAFRRFPKKRLAGLDVSDRAIRFGKAFNPNVEYICGDITDATLFKDRFDIITLIETFEHIPLDDIQAFVRGLHYYTKDDGILILTVPSKNIRVSPTHYQHFNLESLSNALEPFFVMSEHHFINSISKWTKALEWLLVNRFFVLNERHLLNMVYRSYERYFLNAEENDAARICALCRKK